MKGLLVGRIMHTELPLDAEGNKIVRIGHSPDPDDVAAVAGAIIINNNITIDENWKSIIRLLSMCAPNLLKAYGLKTSR